MKEKTLEFKQTIELIKQNTYEKENKKNTKPEAITVHRQAILLFSWNPGHENSEKLWNPRQNLPLMLSVSWIPRQCLSWIPRQHCCYNDTFAAAL